MLSMPSPKAEQPQAENGYSQSAGRYAKQLMLHTACNLFSAVGKQWLALVDRFSGYAWTVALRRLDTKAVILHLESWFNNFDWPTHIRTDGGPQFRSEFKEFCAAHGIQHELCLLYTSPSPRD